MIAAFSIIFLGFFLGMRHTADRPPMGAGTSQDHERRGRDA